MKKTSENRISDARAGFTLLEIVVTVTVFGILTAAAAVNWVSFTKYQKLREDASAFHKELLAAKARALETVDTVWITFANDSYEIKWYVVPENSDTREQRSKLGKLNKNVNISAGGNVTANGDLPPLPGGAGWTNGILILPESIDAFKESGRVIIQNGSKKIFCIQKDGGSIKPLMYYKNGNGTWKKI